MRRICVNRILGMMALSFLAISLTSPEDAHARRYRSHGSSGSSGSHGSSGSSGSHGSSGSSGGWYSSHGSSGSSSSHGSSGSSGGSSSSRGSRGSRGSHGSSGSSGGWYSSHGSSGSSGSSSSHGSSGSSGSSSSHGSSGSSGYVIHHVKVSHPVHPVAPPEAKPLAPPEPATSADRSKATLIVKVPEDAAVYLVGQKMSITGTERRFRIPTADPAKDYSYPVRVEVVRNGKTMVSEATYKIRGGQSFEVAIAESADVGELVAVAMR